MSAQPSYGTTAIHVVASRTITHAAQGAALIHLNDKALMPAPNHAADMAVCTTSDDIVARALNPTLDTLAAAHAARQIIATIHAATSQLAELVALTEAQARDAAGYLDQRATNLRAAEQGKATAGVVQLANGKSIAREINAALDCLACTERDGEHQAARALLHNQFTTHGARIFKNDIAERIGKKRRAGLDAEYRAWAA